MNTSRISAPTASPHASCCRGTLASRDAIDQVKAVAVKVKGVQSVDASPLLLAAK